MYNDSVTENICVKESNFRYVFNSNFNIGFSALYVDECSTWLELKQRIDVRNRKR